MSTESNPEDVPHSEPEPDADDLALTPADESATARSVRDESFAFESDSPRPSRQAAPVGWLFWLALSAVIVGLVSFGQAWWKAKKYGVAAARTNEAVERLRKNQAAEAIVLLTEAVEIDPSLALAWANRAAAHIRLKQYDAARGDCEQALALDPEQPVALANLGSVLREEGDLAGARETLTRALAIDPSAGEAWSMRAGVAYALEDDVAAIHDATEALRLLHGNEQLARMYDVRGAARMRSGDFKTARDDYSEASRLEPTSADLQMRLADCWDGMGLLEDAERHSSNAIALAPDKSRPFEHRANIRFRRRNMAGVVEDSTQAIALNPEAALAYMMRGAARIELKEFNGAIADCDTALRLHPQMPAALLFRGDAYRRRGESARAMEDYSSAIEHQPDMMMAWFGRALARAQARDHQGAIADYSQAIELDPGFPAAWFNRALSHEALGEVEKARADREKALELDPEIGTRDRTEST